MNTVYLGLGSNLSDPIQQIQQAISVISTHDEINTLACSSLYISQPMGPQDQPDYFNAVLKINTLLKPLALLDKLQAIENIAGRVRKDQRWGARVLDIDILLYNNEVIKNDRLTVPHYGLQEREFVVIPLAEIDNQLQLPNGQSIAALANNIVTNGLKIHSQLC
jgi:2-amino-4-hydroxy-6-hydroxymethyldihydropteridine diphosphokinase